MKSEEPTFNMQSWRQRCRAWPSGDQATAPRICGLSSYFGFLESVSSHLGLVHQANCQIFSLFWRLFTPRVPRVSPMFRSCKVLRRFMRTTVRTIHIATGCSGPVVECIRFTVGSFLGEFCLRSSEKMCGHEVTQTSSLTTPLQYWCVLVAAFCRGFCTTLMLSPSQFQRANPHVRY